MTTNDNITLAKGSFSITLPTATTVENWKNVLKIIPGVTTTGNQVDAPNKSQIVDIQRTNYTYVFECYITSTTGPTKTAKQIKDELRVLFEGARTAGGIITLTYEDDSIDVFFEDCVIKKLTSDDPVGNNSDEDVAEYQLTLTFVEGEQA